MAEKTKDSRKRNQKEWNYNHEDRKVEKKDITYFNGQYIIF